jgi:hypothetical protein
VKGVGSKGALLFCVVGTALELVIAMNSLIQGVSNFATPSADKTLNVIRSTE